MKKFLAAFLAFSLIFTGCTSWVTAFKSNPVATLQSSEQYILVAEQVAIGAFDAYVAATGNVSAATIAQFNAIIADVNNGLQVANDALNVAAAAGGPAPNVATIMAQAQTAMGHLATFLAGLQSPASPAPARLAQPTQAVTSLQHAIDVVTRAAGPFAPTVR